MIQYIQITISTNSVYALLMMYYEIISHMGMCLNISTSIEIYIYLIGTNDQVNNIVDSVLSYYYFIVMFLYHISILSYLYHIVTIHY